MKGILENLIFCLFSVLLLMPSTAWGETAGSLVENGNRAYVEGRFPDALDSYNKAVEKDPGSAAAQFNRGDALYRLNDFAGAISAFEQAAEKSRDQPLAAQSKYNLGNAAFGKAEALRSADPQKALTDYQQAAEYYWQSLQLDSRLPEAGRNLEISRLAMKKIKEEMKKQQQSSSGQQKKNDQTSQKDQQQTGQGKEGEKGQPEGEQKKQTSADQQQEEKTKTPEKTGADETAAEPKQETAAPSETARDILNKENEHQLLRRQKMATGTLQVDKDW